MNRFVCWKENMSTNRIRAVVGDWKILY